MPKKASKLLAVVAAIVVSLATASVWSATPSEGSMAAPSDSKLGERANVDYEGGPVAGALAFQGLAAGPVCGEQAASPPVQCDVFTLHFNMPANWYSTHNGVTAKFVATIDWTDTPGGTIPGVGAQDIDLLVFDADGNQVGSGETDNVSSGVTKETALVDRPAGGDYRFIAVGIVGGVSSYKGNVKLLLVKDDQKRNTIRDLSIKFGPATTVSPSLFGGEPAVTTDPSLPKAWWIDWPIGSRSNTGVLFRSLDGGDTFRQMTNSRCSFRRMPGCATAGGGDTMTTVSKGGVVYWADQEALANEAVNVSTDHGMTWPADRENAITSLDASNDRQWLATHGDLTAYISASVANGTGLARTDDGGKTWQAIEPVVGEVPSASGPMLVDNTGGKLDGTLYMLGRDLSIHVSRDKGETFTTWPDTDSPKTGPAGDSNGASLGTPPGWMSMDTAGNLYVAWTDASDGVVRLASMLASSPKNAGDKLGSTWSKPVKVSISPATTTIFTQVTSLDPGHVALTYQGADSTLGPSNTPAGTPWFVYASFSTDALCQWKNTCPAGPSFRQTQLSRRPNHIGNICIDGTLCAADPSADRNLLDFFDIDVDSDGRVGITYTDDNHGLLYTPTTTRGGFIEFAKVADGPSLKAGRAEYGVPATAGLTAAGLRGLGRKGDAQWPVNEPGGKNFPTLDLTGQTIGATTNALKISVDVASTADLVSGLDAGYQGQHVKYLTRWLHGQDVYFVAADTTGDSTEFYGGKIDTNDEFLRTAGTSVYGAKYVRDFDVTGAIENGKVTFTVPFSSVGNLRQGDAIYSLQSFTMVGINDALATVYTAPDVIDVTPAIDYRVGATSVLGSKVTQPSKPVPAKPIGNAKGGKGLAATGVGGETAGLLLITAAFAVWAVRSRRRELARS